MSALNRCEHAGYGPKVSNSYVPLNNYCGNTSSLGVSSVAPIFAAYGANPAYQNVPVFAGVDYQEAPYTYSKNTMFCGQCNGGYCNALKGYHVPTDKAGNPMASAMYSPQGELVSGSPSVYIVKRGDNMQINQSCALNKDGNCTVAQLTGAKQ